MFITKVYDEELQTMRRNHSKAGKQYEEAAAAEGSCCGLITTTILYPSALLLLEREIEELEIE